MSANWGEREEKCRQAFGLDAGRDQEPREDTILKNDGDEECRVEDVNEGSVGDGGRGQRLDES